MKTDAFHNMKRHLTMRKAQRELVYVALQYCVEESRGYAPISGRGEKDAQKAALYGGSGSEPPADNRENLPPAFVDAIGKGRPKGLQNRLTRTMKEAIEKAFDNVGGPAYLEKMANGTATDRQAFMALIGRLLPMQVNSNIDQRIRVELPWLAARGIGKVQAIEAEALQHVGKGRIIDAETPEGQGAAGGMHED